MFIFDVPGDFLQNALLEDKFLLMQIRDEFVDVICEDHPEYIPYMIYESDKKLPYVKIIRDIYGFIEP